MNRATITALVLAAALTACDKIPLPSILTGEKPATPPVTVAVLDMTAVAKALGRDEVARQQLEAAGRQLQDQLSQVTTGLQERLREEQSKLGETPSEAEQRQLQALVADAQRQLQQSQQLARQRATEFQNQLVPRFRAEVQPVAAEVAARHGASTVLLANTVLWFEPAMDITGEVIDALRARDLARSAGPPAAGAAPATDASEAAPAAR